MFLNVTFLENNRRVKNSIVNQTSKITTSIKPSAIELKVLSQGKYLAPQSNTKNFKDFFIGSTSYQSEVATGDWHCHENPMISFILYGKNTESRKSKEKLRTTGSVDFYHSYEPHKNVYNQFPSKHISVEISKSFLATCEYSESDLAFAILKTESPQLLLSRIYKEASFEDLQSKDSIEMMLLSLLSKSETKKELKQLPNWITSLKEILHDEWNKNVSLAELSNQLHIHPCTISKYFSKYIHCTLGEYTRKLKIEKSIQMLRNQDVSLTEIAYDCGFSDQSHFTRVFKSCTGYLPKEYRKL